MLYLSFRVVNEKYAVPVSDVNESVQFSKITKVRHAVHAVRDAAAPEGAQRGLHVGRGGPGGRRV